MRFTLFALALCSVASAQDTFTQKPTVAPSVPRGETVAPKVDASAAEWAKRFDSGPVPLWIWGDTPNKNYTLRTEFAAAGAKGARVKVSADNHVVLFLNGKRVAASDEWAEPAEADVGALLKEKNELVAEVRNAGGVAGFVCKLAIETAKGETQYVVSDGTWTASEKKGGKAAKVKSIGKYADAPWGKVFDNAAPVGNSKVPANTFVTLPGFKVEKLFSVPKDKLGSWVNICADDKGRLIASDQGNLGLVRITPGKPGTDDETKVERIPARITAAQGLLWHKGALYVVCNGGPGSGLYRVTSSKNDDVLDKVEKLKALNGGGEHGPHAVRLAPDGKSLFVICGNHTQPPAGFAHSRLPKNWSEDHILPRQWDANGHAVGILAPGGYVAQTDFDGKTWEIFSAGYRNPYDFAFNADGEMFVYDADMEWDLGMPWYRPTRVNHATSGSELGWRSGTGKWPSYYIDSLPAAVDIGPGSPVGVEFGYGAKFPAKYQKALFICDWTFGTMYAIHLEPHQSTYKATKEEFLSRTPLPLTDVCANPADGALYFTIGGRGANSELYRVTYDGKEPTEQVEYKDPREAKRRASRHRLEALHGPNKDIDEGDLFRAGDAVDSDDRFARYAARVALEHHFSPERLEQTLGIEMSVRSRVAVVVAAARQADKKYAPKLLAHLEPAKLADLEEDELLEVLRAYQLVFVRMGRPEEAPGAKVAERLGALFPSKSDAANRELAQLLVYLKHPKIVEWVCAELKKPSKPLTTEGLDELILRNKGYGGTVASLIKNAADQQKLSYLFTLRNATVGWNAERWTIYYTFLAEARTKAGGASFQKFLTNIEKDAFANASDNERLAIEAAKLRPAYKPPVLPKAVGPGKAWTTADLSALEAKLKSGRDFKNGERAYAAARCVVCHRFGGDGGATGPDLSQVAGRFGLKELAEAIVEPSKVISDQYAAHVIVPVAGKQFIGKIANEANGVLTVVVDPEDASKVVQIKVADIEERRVSKVSLMPEKLLDTLNENEVLDLLAYMLSRGDSKHPMFKK
jgi:putative heme-binding domain-containing protein